MPLRRSESKAVCASVLQAWRKFSTSAHYWPTSSVCDDLSPIEPSLVQDKLSSFVYLRGLRGSRISEASNPRFFLLTRHCGPHNVRSSFIFHRLVLALW